MEDERATQFRVLVVDDDHRTARILARMLREDGLEVEVAHDGAIAIGRLSRWPAPDALVTVLTMAHADGIAVASYARSRRPGLPVFFVTDHPELAERAESLVPEPRIFTKPLDYAAFSRELIGTLDRSATPSGA